jgi:dynein heavy chain
VTLFISSIRNSKKTDLLPSRIKNLNDHFTYSIYRNVCRSLFEKDKLVFSFLLTTSIMAGRGDIDAAEWLFLLTGGVGMDNPHANPGASWLADRCWAEFCRLSDLPAFNGLREDVASNVEDWKAIYDSDEPHKCVSRRRFSCRCHVTALLCLLAVARVAHRCAYACPCPAGE